jgi:tetratricopeptide (TPR) repeat protein
MALLPWAAVAVVDGPRRLRTTPARGLALAAIVLMAATSSAGASQARASAQVAHQTWLGYAYERLDMSAHALAAYEAAVASGAAPADAYRDLARLYRAEGQALRSVAVMQQLVRQRPGDVDALVELGDRLMGAGRALEAEEQYRLAVSNGADRRIVEGRLGDALAAQGDETGAAGAYRNLLADRPDSHRVRFQLARNLQAQGHSAEAAEQFRRLLEAPAWEIRSGLQLTEILALDESRRADTEAILGRLLEREPDLMPALWSLAILLHDAQRYEEALVPLMRLRQLDGDDPATPRLLASAYDRLGRAQEAEEAYALYRRLERRGEIHRTVGSRMREWADKVAQR